MPVNHAKEFLKSVHNEALFSQLFARASTSLQFDTWGCRWKLFDYINSFWHDLPKSCFPSSILRNVEYPNIYMTEDCLHLNWFPLNRWLPLCFFTAFRLSLSSMWPSSFSWLALICAQVEWQGEPDSSSTWSNSMSRLALLIDWCHLEAPRVVPEVWPRLEEGP